MLCLPAALQAQAQSPSRPPPRTIAQLAEAPPPADSALRRVRDLPETASYTAYLVAYQSSGLRVHALVAQPKGPVPPGGFPVLVANHGFHPNPPRYGYGADGADSRPGDYYRAIPALYAAAGFLVVMPDYRGHNNSEGAPFTDGFLASAYYTEDVVALVHGLASLRHVDTSRVFMWGHSMGGEVTLRALLAVGGVRAASLWSTVGGDLWDQAYYYSRYEDLAAEDGGARAKPPMDKLRRHLGAWGNAFDEAAIEPLAHLDRLKAPLILHHALRDSGADYRWSMRLAKELYRRSLPYVFHTLAGDSHFFEGEERRLAVERDVRFFRSHMGAAR